MSRGNKVKSIFGMGIASFAVTATAQAGVTVEMVTRDMAGTETDRSQIYAQDGFLRLDNQGGAYTSDVSLIFDGNSFLVMDHGEKTYIVMDEAMLMEISDKMSEAMKQMEAHLAALPAEQRAMAEQMMQSQLGATEGREPASPPRVEKTGSDSWQGRSCTKFDVFENDIKTQEICSAPLDQINGAAEMMQTYQEMARFVTQLSESLPEPLGSSFNDHPGMVAELIGGFPVHSVEYRMGAPAQQVGMESISEKSLDSALFEAPGDYQQRDPFAAR